MGKVKQIKRKGPEPKVDSAKAGGRNKVAAKRAGKMGQKARSTRPPGNKGTTKATGKPVRAQAAGTPRITKAKSVRAQAAGTPRIRKANGTSATVTTIVAPQGHRSRNNGTRAGIPPVQRTFRVRELVPQQVCGPRTRVHRVFRVEERVNNSSQAHLVFNDHHGWYCEHGADCHAVGEVRKAR